MAAEFGQHGASQNGRQVADRDLLKRQAIEKVIGKLVEEKYKSLHDEFKQDWKSYPDQGIEFVFHNACKYESFMRMELNFIEEVIAACLKLEANEAYEVLKYLFELQNSDGYTPFHVAIESHEEVYLKDFLASVQLSSNPASSILVNTRDSRGWSPIHKILSGKPMVEVLGLVKEKIDWSAKLPRSNATALHFAICCGSAAAFNIIWECASVHLLLNTMLKGRIVYGRTKDGTERSCEVWSPLQLAAMMGNPGVVRRLLTKIGKIYDSSKRNNHGVGKPDNYDDAISALHLAAASGVPEVMKMFVTGDVFDPTKLTSHKRTSIHFATDWSTREFDNEVEWTHESTRPRVSRFRGPLSTVLRRTTTALKDHEGWQACITLLMQAGVNIWQKDDDDTLAGPGSEAPPALTLWWYKARAQDALEAKKDLNDAANAISVVAALVATASYVGPLQPPLGYGTSDPVLDLVQTTKLPIRLFVVTNCLSFYLAIGSILFAVVPSLPMPHLNVDSMYGEWQRSKRTVCIATLFLLMSIVGVLVSFAAASNVGMEDHYSWQHWGLSFYPTILGSMICFYGIVTFFGRLLRLVFEKNVRIRRSC